MTHSTIEGSDKPIRGVTKMKEYRVWNGMVQRCTNPSNIGYNIYGGRGITVCERWRKFSNFIEDMGLRPSDKHSLDRINSDGNYEPSNCRWATWDVQKTNKRLASVLGVHRVWITGKQLRYKAKLTVDGVTVLDELFPTFEDALVARMRAELEYL